MRHGVSLRKLGRDTKHRKALFRNQVTSLIEHERIETTVAKAKELRRIADRIITLGKRNSVDASRRLEGFVRTPEAVKKLRYDIVPRMADRTGGYTRVLKTRHRRGDCAPMAVIELSETTKSILTPEHRRQKEMRKSKYRRGVSPPSLANALEESVDEGDILKPLDPAGKL